MPHTDPFNALSSGQTHHIKPLSHADKTGDLIMNFNTAV